MFWFTLAMFVASFLLTVLLAPKPELEDARPGRLGDIRFPRASAGSPVPLLFGKKRLRGPNTLYFGAFKVIANTKKVKTGIFSSERAITGFSYFLSMDLGLCTGPDVTLHAIWVEKKKIFNGSLTSGNTTDIVQGGLFGGLDRGGGLVGTVRFHGGEFDQARNVYLQTGFPALGNDIPAYVGIAHIVFEDVFQVIKLPFGLGPVTIHQPFYIGTSAQLRPMSFEVSRYPDNLGLGANLLIGEDLNPMEILYSALTEEYGGLSMDPDNLETADMIAVGATLKTEGNGMSLLIEKNNSAKVIIEEVLRQIDGMLYQDPVTGKIRTRLIREDYVVGSLPVFDESNIKKVLNFSRTSWAETFNQVRVTFDQRTRNYEEATALVQDMANIEIQDRIKSLNVSLPGITEELLAVQVASRIMSQRNVPLFSSRFETRRNAQALLPGDPFVFAWDDFNIAQAVMRVQRFDAGELINGRIVMEVIQDSFASSQTLYGAPEDTLWQPEDRTAVDIVSFLLFESPAYFVDQLDPEDFMFQANTSYFWAFARRPLFMERFTLQTSEDVFATDSVNEIDQADFPFGFLLRTKLFSEQGQKSGLVTQIEVGSMDPRGDLWNTATKGAISSTGVNQIRIDNEWMAYESATLLYEATGVDLIIAGSSGYAVSDTITLTGGTFTEATVLTVLAVNAGVITSVSVTTAGTYTVEPTDPVSQGSTSGVGTGATFNITYTNLRTNLNNVYRALHDSTFEDHEVGAVGYLIHGTDLLSRVGRADTDSISYQLLSASDTDAQETGDAPTNSIITDQVYNRPAPPDYVDIEAVRTPIEIIGVVDVDLTWRERTRFETNIAFVDDATDTPESSTTYNARIFLDGIQVNFSNGLAVTNVNLTGLEKRGILRAEVESVHSTLISNVLDWDQCFYANYVSLSAELVTNPGFESALTGWTTDSGTWASVTTSFPLDPVQTVGAASDTKNLESTGTTNALSQSVDLAAHQGRAGLFRIWKGGKTAATGQVKISLLNAALTVIETVQTPLVAASDVGLWELIEIPIPITATTKWGKIEIEGPAADTTWDNASIKANTVSPTNAVDYSTITGLTIDGAWGLRNLDLTNYAGNLVRVRDTFDDTEQDVGFDEDGNLAPFYVRGEARVVKLYDQSGGGADLEQTVEADQPRLLWSLSETGRPYIDFENTEQLLDQTTGTTRPYMVARPNMCIALTHTTSTSGDSYIAIIQHDETFTTPFWRWGLNANGANWQYAINTTRTNEAGAQAPSVGNNVWFMDYQNGELYHNEDVTTTHSFTAANITYPNVTRLRLGRNDSTGTEFPWDGEFYELCIFSGNIAAGDRKTIMESVALYWSNMAV